MTDICKIIEALLRHPEKLQGWQRAYLKSAARCDQISETQARVIQGMDLKNNQIISRGQHG